VTSVSGIPSETNSHHYPKLVLIIFNNSVRATNKTPHFTITKLNFANAVQGNNLCSHLEPYETLINKMADLLIIKAGGTQLSLNIKEFDTTGLPGFERNRLE
jgi:hypothetical protein